MENLKHILVADDEKDCCALLKDYLESRGCEVDVAYNGLDASRLIQSKLYDCVFLDFNMPGLTGLELLKMMKKSGSPARKIIISGYELVDEHFLSFFGVDLFMRKPISLESLSKALLK